MPPKGYCAVSQTMIRAAHKTEEVPGFRLEAPDLKRFVTEQMLEMRLLEKA